ncbi:MAG: C-terminal binding protein [Deltaproteobacteria bacterium]|nr:C-terminal binding protein [Deltaproteobacteria bacterium]MBW2136323.1 C-terminal binding protein [Deltaproteobacteria bacterium]
MTFKVVNTFVIPEIDYGDSLLDSVDADIERGLWTAEEDLISHCQDADAIICTSPAQEWSEKVLDSLVRCRIIATTSIGYDRIPLEPATERAIAVTNIPDYCVDEVSSQAIALMMALARKLFPLDRDVRERQTHFTPGNREAVRDILHPILRTRDQVLGIIGFGKIGTAVALKAKGIGMRVIAYDPYVFGAVMQTHGVQPVDLDTLLRDSDIISINANLTSETRHMIDEEAFKKMKPTCYLVNTARGGIVDQDALIRALQEGMIAGAGLDVLAVEPVPAQDPLLRMPNVILTGHSAWYSTASDSEAEYWHKAMGQVIMALKGRFPTYTVNPEVKKEWLTKWGTT